MQRLPNDASEVVRLGWREQAMVNALCAFARVSGMWRYPARMEGDFERMGLLDIAYWVHKAKHPIEHAQRGSGLEAFFATQTAHHWRLPDGFASEGEIRIAAVGDLFSSAYLARSAQLYADVSELLFGADVSMGNLECLPVFDQSVELSIRTEEAARISLDQPSWEAVRGHGEQRYDFLAVANNHSLDFGAEGLDAALDTLDAAGIAHHGANRREEDAARATVIERGGVRVGIVSWTFGLNARQPPVDRPNIVNRARLNGDLGQIDLSGIAAQLQDARRRDCDFVIAQLHWGMEHERYPRPEQVAVAHALAELGVDAIVGHHSHMVQPSEAYRTKRDPDRVVPIFYSLGNLTSYFRAPVWCHGGLARMRLAKGVHRDGQRCTYVADASLDGLRQEIVDRERTLRLRHTGRFSFAGR